MSVRNSLGVINYTLPQWHALVKRHMFGKRDTVTVVNLSWSVKDMKMRITMPKSRPTRIDPVIGDNCKRLRTEKGMTQADLADQMGYTENFIQQLEAGRKPWNSNTIVAACDALRVQPVALYGGVILTDRQQKTLDLLHALQIAEHNAAEAAAALGLKKPTKKKP